MPHLIKELDKGKPNLTTVPPGAVYAIAEVRRFGLNKHKESQDHREVPEIVWVSKTLRHLFAYLDGDLMDEESGLPHLHHALTDLALAADADWARRKGGQ